MTQIILIPISEIGGHRTGTLNLSYQEIVEKIFKPNCTKLDDPDKVKASWGFQDQSGRKGFIWCYMWYGKKETCKEWSVDGDKNLLIELFGNNVDLK